MPVMRQLVAALTQRCAAALPDAQLQRLAAKEVASFTHTTQNESGLLQQEANHGAQFYGLIAELESSTQQVSCQKDCLELAATAHCSFEVSGRRKRAESKCRCYYLCCYVYAVYTCCNNHNVIIMLPQDIDLAEFIRLIACAGCIIQCAAMRSNVAIV